MKFLSRFVLVVLCVAVFINSPNALMQAFFIVCAAMAGLALVVFILIAMTLHILDRETP